MRVVVERDEVERRARVYVLNGPNAYAAGELTDDGALRERWHAGTTGERRPPLLDLDADLFDAIVREAAGGLAPDAGVVDALSRERATSDRLLALVELTVHRSLPPANVIDLAIRPGSA